MRRRICNELLLTPSDVKTVAIIPDRPNIFIDFHLRAKFFQKELKWMVEEVKKGEACPKIIIYCQSGTDVCEIYGWLSDQLGYSSNVALSERTITMFHSSITETKEGYLSQELPKPDSHVRVVISILHHSVWHGG